MTTTSGEAAAVTAATTSIKKDNAELNKDSKVNLMSNSLSINMELKINLDFHHEVEFDIAFHYNLT